MIEMVTRLWGFLQRSMQKKVVRRALYVGIVLISLAFIGIVIRSNWAQLKAQPWHINIIYLVGAAVLYPIGMFPTVAAWHWLLKAFNAQKPYLLNLRLYAQSSLPRHIPGLVWYVSSRTLLYGEHRVHAGAVIGATAIETALLALSGFISAILLIPLQVDLPQQLTIIRYVIPLSIAILVVFFISVPKASHFVDRLFKRWQKDTTDIQFHRSALWISLVWMFLAWFGGGILLWIQVNAITSIKFDLLPLMVGIWGLAGAVSLTIGIGIQGLGLREVTLGALLSTIIPPLEAVAAAIAFRLVLTIGELLWVLLISILIKNKPTRATGKSPETTVD